eukprot:TRINITY_DN5815_c0_g1_i1.p1 TRINITY_DN5815_c0_g1~~TRINITY_DN5815_c0_g1_i1.p1  ORF type:complete len:1517 (-),score=352.75 TRINITY_DN5815_c0_g1_i1:87-4637(-)
MAFRAHLPASQAPLRRPDDALVDVMRFADPPLGGRNSEFDAVPPPKRIMVPAPPPKPRGGAVRPARALQPSGRGHANRSALKEAVKSQGLGQPGTQRWSTMKALFTELVHATTSNSPTKLLTSIAETKALGGDQWPEFAKAQERLAALQNLRSELLKASDWTDIKEITALLSKADSVGVRYKPDFTVRHKPGTNPKAEAEGEFGPYIEAAERRLERLKALRQELDEASPHGKDLAKISNSVRVAAELGVQGWPEAECAELRLRLLQSLLSKLTSCLGLAKDVDADGQDDPHLKLALQAAVVEAEEVLGDLSTLPPPPLGPALEAVQQRLAMLRLEGVAGFRTRLRHELDRAAEQGDILAIRAALAEADRLQRDSATRLETAWAAPERARRRLAEFVGLEAELQLLSSRDRVLPPPPGAIEAALARADALNCGEWPQRAAAAERLEELKSLEAGLLRAVEDGSEVELLEATRNAEDAGLTAWPLLNSAQSLLFSYRSAAAVYVSPNAAWRQFSCSWAAQRLLVELSGVRPMGRRTSSCSVGWSQVVYAGLALELNLDADGIGGLEDKLVDMDLLAKSICKASGGRSAENLRLLTVKPDLLVAGFQITSAAPTDEASTSCAQDSLVLLEKELRDFAEVSSRIAEKGLSFEQRAGREPKHAASTNFDPGPNVKAVWLLYSLITEQQDQEKQLEELRRLQQRLQQKLEERIKQLVPRPLPDEDEYFSIQQVDLRSKSPEVDGSEMADEHYASACRELVEDIVQHELDFLRASPASPDLVDLLFENRSQEADAEVAHVFSKTFKPASEARSIAGSIMQHTPNSMDEELAYATVHDSWGGVAQGSQMQGAPAQIRPKSFSPMSYLTGSGASCAQEQMAFAAVDGILGAVRQHALVDAAPTPRQQSSFSAVSGATASGAGEELAFATSSNILAAAHQDSLVQTGPTVPHRPAFSAVSAVSSVTGSGVEDMAFLAVDGILDAVRQEALEQAGPSLQPQKSFSSVSGMTGSGAEEALAFAAVADVLGAVRENAAPLSLSPQHQGSFSAVSHMTKSACAEELASGAVSGALGAVAREDVVQPTVMTTLHNSMSSEELALSTMQAVPGAAAHDAERRTSIPRPISAASHVTGSAAEELAFLTIHGALGAAAEQDSVVQATSRANGVLASTVSEGTLGAAENSAVRSTLQNIFQQDQSAAKEGTGHAPARQQRAASSDGIPKSLENSVVHAAVGIIVGDAANDLSVRDSLSGTLGMESASAAEELAFLTIHGALGAAAEQDSVVQATSRANGALASTLSEGTLGAAENSAVRSTLQNIFQLDQCAAKEGTGHAPARQQHAAPSDGTPNSLKNSVVQAAVGNIVCDAVNDFSGSDSRTGSLGIESVGAAEDAVAFAAVEAVLQRVGTPVGSEHTDPTVNEDASPSFPSVTVYDPSPSTQQQDSVVSAIMAGVFNYSEAAPSSEIAVPARSSLQLAPHALAEAVVCDLLWDSVRGQAGIQDVHRRSVEKTWAETYGGPSLLTPKLESAGS